MWGRSMKVSQSVHGVHQISGWACIMDKLWNVQGLLGVFPWLLCSLAWYPSSGVFPQFSQLPLLSGGKSNLLQGFGNWMQSLWCVEAGWLKQVTRTRSFVLRSVLEDIPHVCAESDRYVQSLVWSGSHQWLHYQGCGHIIEENWQACLGEFRWLKAYNTAKLWVKHFGPGLSICRLLSAIDWTSVEVCCERKINTRKSAFGSWDPRGVEDNTEATLVKLDQSKPSDRVDHRF